MMSPVMRGRGMMMYAVSSGDCRNRMIRMVRVMKTPSVRATMAIPEAIRTACMSLVMRAMKSPVFLPAKKPVCRSIRWPKSFSRSSASIRREVPWMKWRHPKRAQAMTKAVPRRAPSGARRSAAR